MEFVVELGAGGVGVPSGCGSWIILKYRLKSLVDRGIYCIFVPWKVIFHGAKRTLHDVKRISHGVKRTFHDVKYTSNRLAWTFT